MKLFFPAAALALAMLTASAQAQGIDPRCPATTQSQAATQDGCQKAIDLFNYMAPQLSGALAANPVPGARIASLTLSAGAVAADIPQFTNTGLATTGATSTAYQVKSNYIPAPSATGALTIFPGFQSPIGHIAQVTMLGSFTYIPNVTTSGVSLTAVSSNYAFSGGTRLDLVQEGDIMPSIAVSTIRRATPLMNLRSAIDAGDTVRVDTLGLSSVTRRVEATKHFGLIGVMAGYASNHLTARGVARGTVSVPASASQPVGPVALTQDITRTGWYAGANLGTNRFSLRVEGGNQSGGSIPTYNTFSSGSSLHPADRTRFYGSAGVTVGF